VCIVVKKIKFQLYKIKTSQ